MLESVAGFVCARRSPERNGLRRLFLHILAQADRLLHLPGDGALEIVRPTLLVVGLLCIKFESRRDSSRQYSIPNNKTHLHNAAAKWPGQRLKSPLDPMEVL